VIWTEYIPGAINKTRCFVQLAKLLTDWARLGRLDKAQYRGQQLHTQWAVSHEEGKFVMTDMYILVGYRRSSAKRKLSIAVNTFPRSSTNVRRLDPKVYSNGTSHLLPDE
jgi:hypothetical protein